MAEGSQGGPGCNLAGGRQDLVSGSGGCSFPEYELPELSTRAFHVGAFGELWRGRLRGAGDLSLTEPPASVLPASQGSADSDQEDAAVARDLNCSLEAAAELRTVCGFQPAGVSLEHQKYRDPNAQFLRVGATGQGSCIED
ncbi:small nuclear RNA activating complex, polypeptide 3 [Saguinus oedipus]|uniref:Small nuclear RNA activating complex, polypeptide 3 n=1 Tax=Saguinus oedipus TaxID=9490 RepID=A0ABQ9WDP8_SAGOE|nr:small nuclear RNA activating complex, polypeptide 3 [Saguinus oedipus]